jgi:glycosyltransferase involved in cell wall biosynthesis
MDISPNHILMIVPHEPELDPRIKWVTELCASIASTHIIACVDTGTKPLIEVDGMVTTERVNYHEQETGETNGASFGAIAAGNKRSKNGKQPAQRNTLAKWLAMIVSKLASPIYRFILIWKYNRRIIKALDARLAQLSFTPGVIICHDLLALAAGVKVKRRCQAALIYDSHEFWPEADLQATRWQQKAMALIERRWIRQADRVITVTQGLASALEQLYGLSGVLSVPNAEPLASNPAPFFEFPPALPVKFLLQGQVTPGRGIEEFLDAWSGLDDERCTLILRAPENDHLAGLRKKFRREIEQGRIYFAPAVPESELIAAARSADIGIIPYSGPSINHIHACPNKLSQYMQAGLAILYNADLEFVSQVVNGNQCGLSYRMDDLQGFYQTIHLFLDKPEELMKMKTNAYHFVRTEFNWEIQSKPYEQAIRKFYVR